VRKGAQVLEAHQSGQGGGVYDHPAARAFDEKVESLIVDSHDGANRIQDPDWCKGGQS
jgi:hypothetical protein